jgi:hypothetical protein
MRIADDPEIEVIDTRMPTLEAKTKNSAKTDAGTKGISSIELLTGAAVIDLLLKPEFQKNMDLLFDSCSWATVFQSSTYITAWYQTYRHKHLPVLVIAKEHGQLKGMLPMALLDTQTADRLKNRKRITGAGHYDAEYQTWLAVPGYGEDFIKDALAEIMKQFPGHPVTFRYLPPGTPLDWLKNDKKWRRYGILQSYTRPLINLHKPDHAKLLQSKQYKNKLNRLKRLGEVHLEIVRDPEVFKSNLDELAVLYDFRFSALFNKHHFRDDPSKKELLLELFRLQLLHVTILKVNGKTFAAVVGVAGKDWVYLSGFSCHSPFNARIYSPGLLNFSLLAKRLKEEQTHYFDLTPGYDSYKDKLANEFDEVHELLINSNMSYLIKKRVRKWVHMRLLAAGIRPMTAEVNLRKYFYQLRNISVMAAIKNIAKGLQKKIPQKRYAIPQTSFRPDIKTTLNKDNLNDLMNFETDKSWGITRWAFLEDAMYRFENGQHCFTWVENNRLLGCVWFCYPDAPLTVAKDNLTTNNEIELKHLYYHKISKGQVQTFLYNIMDILTAEKTFDCFVTNNKLVCQALEALNPVQSATTYAKRQP